MDNTGKIMITTRTDGIIIVGIVIVNVVIIIWHVYFTFIYMSQ